MDFFYGKEKRLACLINNYELSSTGTADREKLQFVNRSRMIVELENFINK